MLYECIHWEHHVVCYMDVYPGDIMSCVITLYALEIWPVMKYGCICIHCKRNMLYYMHAYIRNITCYRIWMYTL